MWGNQCEVNMRLLQNPWTIWSLTEFHYLQIISFGTLWVSVEMCWGVFEEVRPNTLQETYANHEKISVLSRWRDVQAMNLYGLCESARFCNFFRVGWPRSTWQKDCFHNLAVWSMTHDRNDAVCISLPYTFLMPRLPGCVERQWAFQVAFKAGSLDLLGRMGALEKAGIGRLKLSMFDTQFRQQAV